jgi:hypothetical protein
MQITRVIDHRWFPRRVLAEARQAFQDYCTLNVTPLGNDQVRVVITVKPKHAAHWKNIVLGFFNYALDKAAEAHFEETQ